jgi:hypothetical protein
VGVLLVYLFGVALRVDYTLHIHPPEAFVSSDMYLYVSIARYLASAHPPLQPWDVTHPLGYPALLSFLISGGGSLARAADLQMVVSCLVPLALGLLGAAAFGRRTGLAATAIASIYFPFIEYGALFLSEIYFILFLALAFAAFFGAMRARRLAASLGLAAAGGLSLSIAIAMKSVALPAAIAFFAVEGVALVLRRGPDGATATATASASGTAASPASSPASSWIARLKPWFLRGVVVAVAAAPLMGVLARVCTRANRGHFCVTGNKVGADFLLGHYGRIADIAWGADEGHGFAFGSPGAYLRHYEEHSRVPFPLTDNAANAAEAWRWIFAHPFDAVVVSLDHVYDVFFGVAMWPTYGYPSWQFAQLFQYAFVLFLFVPTVLACATIVKRGARAVVTSRTLLVLSPILALTATVAIATGEVRYRIPFDIFFIVVACAFVVGDLKRVDGAAAGGAG